MGNASGSGLPPAGWYFDSQTPGRERWWDGSRWGEHTRVEQRGTITAPHRRESRHSSLTCPACGSADVKTLKAIRAQGTTTGTGHSTGWVSGTDGQPGHSVSMTTRTTNYTAAAREAAPPSKRQNGVTLVVAGVLLGALLGWIGWWLGSAGTFGDPALNMALAVVIGVALMAIGVVLLPGDLAYNRDEFPAEVARWNRSWQCQRCGSGFVV